MGHVPPVPKAVPDAPVRRPAARRPAVPARAAEPVAAGPTPTIEEFIEHPPLSRMFATLDTLVFYPADDPEFRFPPDERVLFAIAAYRLTGTRYDPDMVRELQTVSAAYDTRVTGLKAQRAPKALLEPRLAAIHLTALREWLRDHGKPTDLDIDPGQEWMITAGRLLPPPPEIMEAAARKLGRDGDVLPEIVRDRSVLTSIVAQYGRQLRPYVDAASAWDAQPSAALAETAADRFIDLMTAFAPITSLLEIVRADQGLTAHAGYGLLFPERDDGSRGTNSAAVTAFHHYVPTQPEALLTRARETVEGRDELLDGFLVYFERRPSPEAGDLVVTDEPSRANAPAIPSHMSAFPELQPPFFDAARHAVHDFTMTIEWPDVYEALGDAFGGWSYEWSLIRVSTREIADLSRTEASTAVAAEAANLDEAKQAEGTGPSFWSPLATELERDLRHAGEDLDRVSRDLTALEMMLGPAGNGAQSLVAVAAMLRPIGTVIKSVLREATQPSYAEEFALDDVGLHLVRCRATPRIDESRDISTLRRATSVAWLPIRARDTRRMAELRTTDATQRVAGAETRLGELEALLASPDRSLPDQDQLVAERAALRLQLQGTAGEILQDRLGQVTAQLAKGGPDKAALAAEKTSLEAILDKRKRHEVLAGRPTVRLPATLVTDAGDVISLLLEAARTDDGTDDSRARWVVADLTTGKSGIAEEWSNGEQVPGDPNHDALLRATLAVLEGESGYDRGYLSIFLPSASSTATVASPSSGGKAHTVRVAKTTGALAIGALESIAQLVSIAAIVAAPFTGGASLVLMVPVGVIGAIPSAYRLMHRAEMDTLRLGDPQTITEIVDVAGSALGVGGMMAGTRAASATARGAVRAALRAEQIGKVLWVAGFGTDGLGLLMIGSGVVQQLEALKGLPPGVKAARQAEIFGNALLSVGVQVGGALASHRYGQTPVDAPHAPQRPEAKDRTGRQSRHPVSDNPDLPEGEVRVIFEADEGLIEKSSIRIEVGPGGARHLDVHLLIADALRGYTGLAGRIRRVLTKARAFLTGNAAPQPGDALFDAHWEVFKLDIAVRDQIRILDRTRDPVLAEKMRNDLEHLTAQLDRHAATIAGGVSGPSRGYIAVEGKPSRTRRKSADKRNATKPATLEEQAVAAGEPAAPTGHYYRRRSKAEGGGFTLVPTRKATVVYRVRSHRGRRVAVQAGTEAEMANRLAKEDGYDDPPAGHAYEWVDGRWEIYRLRGEPGPDMKIDYGQDGLPRRDPEGKIQWAAVDKKYSYDRFRATAAAKHPAATYAPLEAALDTLKIPAEPHARGIFRRWAGVLTTIDGLAAAHPGQNLPDGAAVTGQISKGLTPEDGKTEYDGFRRALREAQLDVVTGRSGTEATSPTPVPAQRQRLETLLRVQPDPGSAGHLFTGWLKRLFSGGGDTAQATLLPGRDLYLGHGQGRDRYADMAIRVSETVDGKTVTREFLAENKAGDSFDSKQAVAYGEAAGREGGLKAEDGHGYDGVAYLCETMDNADAIAIALDVLKVHPDVRVYFVDANGILQPVPRGVAVRAPKKKGTTP